MSYSYHYSPVTSPMSTQEYNAIVLLGASGVGKDTIAKEVIKLVASYRVVKFAQPIKNLVAAAVGVDPSVCEDRAQRCLPIVFLGGEVKSILELLMDSYRELQGSEIHQQMVEEVIAHAGALPIFTDVRNDNEAEAILKTYPWIKAYWVFRPGHDRDVAGMDRIQQLASRLKATHVHNLHPDSPYQIAKHILG